MPENLVYARITEMTCVLIKKIIEYQISKGYLIYIYSGVGPVIDIRQY